MWEKTRNLLIPALLLDLIDMILIGFRFKSWKFTLLCPVQWDLYIIINTDLRGWGSKMLSWEADDACSNEEDDDNDDYDDD